MVGRGMLDGDGTRTGRWGVRRVAAVAATALVVQATIVAGSIGADPVSAAAVPPDGDVFDTPAPDEAPRVEQPRNVTSIVPARLLETRSGPMDVTVDGEFEGVGRVGAGVTLELPVVGRGGVPGDASAVMLNVTAVGPSAEGFLTVFPCGEARPLASNVNYVAGDVVPNAVLAKVGVAGRVCIYSWAETDVVVDVNGYTSASSGTTPLVPARLLETRSGPTDVTVDGEFEGVGRVAADGTVELQVTGRGGVPELGVGAVMLNVTAVGPDGPGFLTVSPCGQDRPFTSNVNYAAGDVVPNAVLAQVGNGGTVCIYTFSSTDIVVDVTGWFDLPPNQPESNVTVLDEDEFVFTTLSGGASTASLIGDRITESVGATGAPLVPDPERAEITTDTTDLAVGDLIVLTKPSGEPYYGRVEATTPSKVTTEQVALAEVMPVMDVALEADTDTGTVTKGEGGESVSGVEIDDSKQTTTGPEPAQGSCSSTADFSVTANAQADAGRFVFDVSIGFFELNSARIGYNPSVSASVTVSASAALSCDVSKTLLTRKLPTIKFFVGPIPVWITQEVSVGLAANVTATASGSRTFAAEAEAFVGIVFENGQWDRETSITFDVTQSSEADISISATLKAPTITYAARAYGIVGFDATVAGVLRLEYRPLAKKYVRLTASIDVELSLVVELDLEVAAFRWEHAFVNATLFGPVELWSRQQSVASCTTAWSSGISRAQCEALVDLWDVAGGAAWTNAGAWVTNTDPCTWEGVVCSVGQVRELNLDGAVAGRPDGVDGPLPTALGALTGLRALRLASSQIDSVPGTIGALDQLQLLDLTSAGVTSVPSEIGSLPSLQVLDLASNELTSLPPTIGDLTALRELYLDDNPQLSTIPRQVGELPNLTRLAARGASLTTLPSTVNDLSSLVDLWVDTNPLTSMPYLGDLSNLEVLFVAFSELPVLPGGVDRLSSLTYLDGSGMRLTSLPPEVGELTDLEFLFLYDNQMSGDITETMRRLRANSPDVSLELSGNGCLTITDPSVRAWVTASDPDWNDGC